MLLLYILLFISFYFELSFHLFHTTTVTGCLQIDLDLKMKKGHIYYNYVLRLLSFEEIICSKIKEKCAQCVKTTILL